MNTNIFTFWEGKMPEYIELCLYTWRFPFTILNYNNLHNYADLPIESMKRFSLAQQADCVRVHVLRDQGGYWLDADTIMLSDRLPDGTITGDPDTCTNTIGFLHTHPHSEFFTAWAAYQDGVLADPNASHHWSVMGNRFTDSYLKYHDEQIVDVRKFWPETYMIKSGTRYNKYLKFYFERSYRLSDIEPADMIMLHNSWTPAWYKGLPAAGIYARDCTLSNFLQEVTKG